MATVWAFFDQAAECYGTPWPVHYRLPQDDRLAALHAMDVRALSNTWRERWQLARVASRCTCR
jgi:hypothetical protein